MMKLSLPILLTFLPLLSWAGTAQASPQPDQQPLETSPASAEIKAQQPLRPSTQEPHEKAETHGVKAKNETNPHTAPTHLTPQDPRYWAGYCPPCGRG